MESSSHIVTLIQIHPKDTIAVLPCSVKAGDSIRVADSLLKLEKPVGLGHKFALETILPGQNIIKYGVSIGSATARIEQGGHVHLHNMKSDYIPTYTLEEGAKFQQ
jgi:(2R)-sulfolactate sulfo-lyase subunit alpha